jgi:hypothetical protein
VGAYRLDILPSKNKALREWRLTRKNSAKFQKLTGSSEIAKTRVC